MGKHFFSCFFEITPPGCSEPPVFTIKTFKNINQKYNYKSYNKLRTETITEIHFMFLLPFYFLCIFFHMRFFQNGHLFSYVNNKKIDLGRIFILCFYHYSINGNHHHHVNIINDG